MPPWHPGGTTKAPTGSCLPEPRWQCVTRAPSVPCRGYTASRDGHPPCAGHRQAARAALTWPQLPVRVRDCRPPGPREVGGFQPAGRAPVEDAPQTPRLLPGSVRQEHTSAPQIQTAPSAPEGEERQARCSPARAPRGGCPRSPPGQAGAPWKGQKRGAPQIPTSAQRRCPRSRPGELSPRAPHPDRGAPTGSAPDQHRQRPTGASDTGGGRDAVHVLPRPRPTPERETLSRGSAPGA